MLCEPLAMASVFRSISHTTRSSSSSSSYNQYGAWVPCSSSHHQKASHLKLRDMSSFSNSNKAFLVTKSQLACFALQTTTEKIHEDLVSSADNAQETLNTVPLPSSTIDDAITPSLPKRYAHLSELVSQLCAGVDIPSAMDPWLQKLSLYDWNQLLIACGRKDWNIAMQIMDFFREKEALLDQSVLSPQRDGEDTSDSSTETSDESSKDFDGGGNSEEALEAVLQTPQESALQGDEKMTGSVTEKPSTILAGNDQEESSKSAGNTVHAHALKLYTTLVNILARRRRFEEVECVQLQMKEAGIEPNGHFYNVLLDCYVERRYFVTAFEILQEMKSAGFEPHHFVRDKLAYVYMNQENPNMEVLKEVADDIKERSLPVFLALYKKILKIHWAQKDVVGVEEAFEAMLVTGYTPDLKVLLKVMQLNGRRGNHGRVVELLELMVKLGIKPNAGVYDCLVHAYCKSGLLDKAKETLLKFESVLGLKPTIIALNMLIDGYGKQGLHEEALEIFEQIKRYGFWPTEVSYSSIISAMAQVGKVDSAAQLYGRMLKERTLPNLHTYSTLIRCYTKCNQTREGDKIYKAMRKAPLQMTEAAYSTALALYVEGTWYHHAAALLREIEEQGKVLEAAGHSALIRSFSFLHNKMTPLSMAVQESGFKICRLLTKLFNTTSESQKLEPELIEEVLAFLEEWREIVSLEAKALVHNAFMEYFWRKGYREMAKKVLDMGREAYAGYSKPQENETEWVVDVRGLGVGGAKVALIDCLVNAEEASKEFGGNDWNVVVVTGDQFSLSLPQDNRVVKQAVESMLAELGSPFVQSQRSSGSMEASLADILKWLSQAEVKEALSFTDLCGPVQI